MQARDSALRGANTTLEIAILEAIVELDSDQSDAVDTLGEGNRVEYTDDGNVRLGQLQRLDLMEKTFFGDTSTDQKGLIAQMREMADPNAPDLDL